MTYFEGFIVPVPEANRDAYRKHAGECRARCSGTSASGGRSRRGTTTFPKARSPTSARRSTRSPTRRSSSPGSNIRTARRATRPTKKMMSDPRMEEHGLDDAVRRQAHDHRRLRGDRRGRLAAAAATPTASSSRCPKASAKPIASSRRRWRRCSAQHGATRVVEAFADDVPKGKVTDFYRAVKAEDGEGVVFSFIEWPDKATRDEAWKAIMADESLKPQGEMPFDGTAHVLGRVREDRRHRGAAGQPPGGARSTPDRTATRSTNRRIETMTDVQTQTAPAQDAAKPHRAESAHGDFIWYELMTPDRRGLEGLLRCRRRLEHRRSRSPNFRAIG